MRKIALLAAVVLAAAFTTTTTTMNAAAKDDPFVAANKNTDKLLRDAMNPYGATSKPAKVAKKGKKKKG